MDSLISFATLLSTAQFLAQLLPERIVSDKPNVLFVLFNGESYDFIGSQRFVYDVKKGFFPSKIQGRHEIGMENIEMMIDIGSLDDLRKFSVYRAKDFSGVVKQSSHGIFVSESTECFYIAGLPIRQSHADLQPKISI